MSRQSDGVKNWRMRTKQRIIDSMGGCCQICDYNKCNDALELHHIDPKQKELRLGGIRANPIAWEKICDELMKCILLCSNCHREVENGMTKLPDKFDTFNESYRIYYFKPELETRKCANNECNANFKIDSYKKNRFCGTKCSQFHARKIERPSREQLEKEIYIDSFLKIGKRYNVSDSTIRKWCISYNLPYKLKDRKI